MSPQPPVTSIPPEGRGPLSRPASAVFPSPWPGPGNSEGPPDPEGWISQGLKPVALGEDDPLVFTDPWPGPGNSETSVAATPRRWLVDGMNVIGSRPDRWWQDRDGAVRDLVRLLEGFSRDSADQVVVVFDHRPPGLTEGPHGGVEVAFARRPGRDAGDDEIVRRVSADPAPDGLVVVTSDRRLGERVAAAGASVYPAGRFRSRLDRVP